MSFPLRSMPHSTIKVPALVSIVLPSLLGHTPVEVASEAVEVVVAGFDDTSAESDSAGSVRDGVAVEVEDDSAAAVVVEDLPELGIGGGSLQELT